MRQRNVLAMKEGFARINGKLVSPADFEMLLAEGVAGHRALAERAQS